MIVLLMTGRFFTNNSVTELKNPEEGRKQSMAKPIISLKLEKGIRNKKAKNS